MNPYLWRKHNDVAEHSNDFNSLNHIPVTQGVMFITWHIDATRHSDSDCAWFHTGKTWREMDVKWQCLLQPHLLHYSRPSPANSLILEIVPFIRSPTSLLRFCADKIFSVNPGIPPVKENVNTSSSFSLYESTFVIRDPISGASKYAYAVTSAR